MFLEINKPESSLKMIALASERLPPSDTRRHDELEDLKRRATKALEPPPIFKLPVEILNEIVKLVFGESNPKMLILTLVCKHWRYALHNSPEFWRQLTITPRTKQKKVKTWLERSRGVIFELNIKDYVDPDSLGKLFQDAPDKFWSLLKVLKVHYSHGQTDISHILPPGAYQQLRLESLELAVARYGFRDADFWKPLGSLDVTRLKSFALSTQIATIPWSNISSLTSLTTLRLEGVQTPGPILDYLQRNPYIEQLRLADSQNFPGNLDDQPELPEKVELNSLRHLEIDSAELAGVLLSHLHFPQLAILSLRKATPSDFEYLATQNLPEFTQLSVERSTLDCHVLSNFIRSCTSLRHLKLSSIRPVNGTVNDILEAMSSPSQEICNPRLQHLYLINCPRLQRKALIQIVKAHLPLQNPDEEPPRDSSDLPLPILTLVLDDCPLIESDTITWLRDRVPTFNFRLKKEKWRR